MRQILSLLFVSLLLNGCSSTSGVIKIGADTYTISTSASPGKGGVPAAKRNAYQEANAECVNRGGLELHVLNEKSTSPTLTEGMAIVEINFTCLPKGDPEFQRKNQN